MDITNPVTNTAAHPNSKLWLGVTIAVAVISGVLIWYFLRPTTEPQAITPDQSGNTQKVSNANLVSASQELKAVDVTELKIAVDELKTTLEAFD